MPQLEPIARARVTISVNFDAETLWEGMFPESRAMPKTLSMGEYGAAHGLARVLQVLQAHRMEATFFVPGRVAERYPEHVLRIQQAGHEIGLRGLRGENLGALSESDQRRVIEQGARVLEILCKRRPFGFRAPWGEVTPATYHALADAGFTYSSSLHGDDRPYRPDAGAGLVEIPWHWELYDWPYFAFNYRPAFPDGQGRIASYSAVLKTWLHELEGYRQEDLLFHLVVTPQTIGSPGRIALLETMLAAIQGRDAVACCGDWARRFSTEDVR